jgi:hypothetical protein
MSRLFLAIRVCWRTLIDAAFARQAVDLLSGKVVAATPVAPATAVKTSGTAAPQPVHAERKPQRSDALTLLATLQREARLIDFLKESLGDYSDAQIGAAVRDVHRDAAAVIDRLFNIRPISAQGEGEEIQAPLDADRYRFLGTVRGSPPHRGKLVHPGWEAGTCEVAELLP